jgi:hypothetical protein
MKNTIFRLFGLVGLVLIFSCEPIELPEPQQEGVPFSVEGQIGGNPVSFGLNSPGYKMMTEAKYLDSDTIWTLSGRLGPDDSATGPALSIHFRYPVLGRQRVLSLDQLFDSLRWEFFQPNGIERDQHPLNVSIQAPDSLKIVRVYSPQLSSTFQNQRQASFRLNQRQSTYVCVEYKTDKEQIGRFCSTIRPSNVGSVPVLNWNIEDQMGSSAVIKANINSAISLNNTLFKWQNGNFSADSVFLANRVQKIKVEAKSALGLRMEHEKELVRGPNAYETYGNNLSLEAEWKPLIRIIDRIQTGTVRLRYTDSSGGNWFWRPQPGTNPSFEILEYESFKKNDLGQSTAAIRIRLSATLHNMAGNSLEIENLDGWFAVALPS